MALKQFDDVGENGKLMVTLIRVDLFFDVFYVVNYFIGCFLELFNGFDIEQVGFPDLLMNQGSNHVVHVPRHLEDRHIQLDTFEALSLLIDALHEEDVGLDHGLVVDRDVFNVDEHFVDGDILLTA